VIPALCSRVARYLWVLCTVHNESLQVPRKKINGDEQRVPLRVSDDEKKNKRKKISKKYSVWKNASRS
jgi:hypothetical protein